MYILTREPRAFIADGVTWPVNSDFCVAYSRSRCIIFFFSSSAFLFIIIFSFYSRLEAANRLSSRMTTTDKEVVRLMEKI